jgi:hypothetical protein
VSGPLGWCAFKGGMPRGAQLMALIALRSERPVRTVGAQAYCYRRERSGLCMVT